MQFILSFIIEWWLDYDDKIEIRVLAAGKE